MSTERAGGWASAGITVGFAVLAVAFLANLWGRPAPTVVVPATRPVFISTNTVRLSAAELIASGGDISGMDCYACHDKAKPVVVHTNAAGGVIVPEAHQDLVFSRSQCSACHAQEENVEIKWTDDGKVIVPAAHQDLMVRHGESSGNDHCFNCHDAADLTLLKTADGRRLRLAESTALCANCHGPSLRDWKAGIHGRTGGYWDRGRGPAERKDCVSCHDPHRPAFPRLKPAPAPRYQPAHRRAPAGNPQPRH